MRIKLGTWEANASNERISFEGGSIESPTEARIVADMLHRWADAFESHSQRDELLEDLLQTFGPELVEYFQQLKRESEARTAHFEGGRRRSPGRGDLN